MLERKRLALMFFLAVIGSSGMLRLRGAAIATLRFRHHVPGEERGMGSLARCAFWFGGVVLLIFLCSETVIYIFGFFIWPT